jgi:hypothetical protein
MVRWYYPRQGILEEQPYFIITKKNNIITKILIDFQGAYRQLRLKYAKNTVVLGSSRY